MNIVKELTPELAEKIWKSIEKKRYNDKVSQEAVLHHLKQLKAQMGKEKKQLRNCGTERYDYRSGIVECMTMIDKKIEKIKAS